LGRTLHVRDTCRSSLSLALHESVFLPSPPNPVHCHKDSTETRIRGFRLITLPERSTTRLACVPASSFPVGLLVEKSSPLSIGKSPITATAGPLALFFVYTGHLFVPPIYLQLITEGTTMVGTGMRVFSFGGFATSPVYPTREQPEVRRTAPQRSSRPTVKVRGTIECVLSGQSFFLSTRLCSLFRLDASHSHTWLGVMRSRHPTQIAPTVLCGR
jgi:hypothetical protein